MKVVPLYKKEIPVADLREEAIGLEKLIRSQPGNEHAYTRLMIIYRKLKEYKKEITIINTAIKVFEEKFRKKQPVFDKKVTALSKALLKATGLADKKGNNMYEYGELSKWRKRKALVMKKI